MIAQTFRACILLLPKIIVLALAARVPSRSNLLPNGQSKGKEAPGLLVSPWRFRVHPV
jgi:hypothetical protein